MALTKRQKKIRFWVRYCIIKLENGMSKEDLQDKLLLKFTPAQVTLLKSKVKKFL